MYSFMILSSIPVYSENSCIVTNCRGFLSKNNLISLNYLRPYRSLLPVMIWISFGYIQVLFFLIILYLYLIHTSSILYIYLIRIKPFSERMDIRFLYYDKATVICSELKIYSIMAKY